jgi:hypothetical protein
MNIDSYSDQIKMIILFVLLICLVGISLSFFVFNSGNVFREGLETKEIVYEYQAEISSNSPTIPDQDKNNGYYILPKSKNADGTVNENAKYYKVKLPYGYYKVDDNTMATIPYGYILQPQGQDITVDYMKQIIPKTVSNIYKTGNKDDYNKDSTFFAKPKSVIAVPANGEIPEGMYVIPDNQNKMAPLPPNMKPNITSVEISGTRLDPTLKKIYSDKVGYVSEKEYYDKVFTVTNSDFLKLNNLVPTSDKNFKAVPLPEGLYYYDNKGVDKAATSTNNWEKYDNENADKVQFLPYGKLAKQVTTEFKIQYPLILSKYDVGDYMPGYIDNPGLISKTGKFDYTKSYSDIKSNYDVEFHGNLDVIKSQNDMYDVKFGEVTVLDQTGNLVVLPRSKIEGDITYFRPSTYTFGAATYVPKYEDSVYLSRTSQMPSMSEYRSAFKTVGFCEENKASSFVLEEKCNALKPDICGSTSCCVLLGGAKCVSGNISGPYMKQNYGDVFVRNKDYYTHMGKCYGNCPTN